MERIPHGAVPIALPFDDESDAPVPFTLTAAAHRALDPSDVPALRVVPDRSRDTDGPGADAVEQLPSDDLRPAQARALRRSGMRPATIAAAMDVEPGLVLAWTADLGTGSRRASAAVPSRSPGSGRRHRPDAGARNHAVGPPTAPAGLAVAMARIDAVDGSVSLTGARSELLAAALAAIRAEVPVRDAAIRVAARAGRGQAADRVRADVARTLAVPVGRVVVGRGAEASFETSDDGEATIRVRIADERVADVLDAWASMLAAEAAPRLTAT